jgi:4-amino-4-deoxy-L-arabinose transferase-like glycosyltransferase
MSGTAEIQASASRAEATSDAQASRPRLTSAPRGFSAVAAVLCALLLGLQGVSLFAPIVGEVHNWRESDTYSVARNFYTVSGDFFHPRIDWNNGRSGIMGMEAPIYPYLTYLAMHVFGERPATARFVAWLFFLAGGLAWYFAFRSIWGVPLTLTFLLVLLLSPLVLFECRQIMPDGPMLGALLFSAAYFVRSSNSKKKKHFAIGMVSFAMAVLLRPPAMLVTPAMWLFSAGEAKFWSKAALRRLPWFVLPGVVFYGWYMWSQHLTAVYEEGHRYFAYALDWKEILINIKSVADLKIIFGSLVPAYVMNWVLLPAIGVGAALSLRKQERRLALPFWLWLLGGISLCFPFSHRFPAHAYYATMVVPPLAYFCVLTVKFLLELVSRESSPTLGERWLGYFLLLTFAAAPLVGGAWKGGIFVVPPEDTWMSVKGVIVALGIGVVSALIGLLRAEWRRGAFVLGLAVAACALIARGGHDVAQTFVQRAAFGEWRRHDVTWKGLREAVDCYSAPEDPFVAIGDGAWWLHLVQRRGFIDQWGVFAGRGLGFYRQRNVNFLFEHRYFGGPWLRIPGIPSPLAGGEKWRLYCLAAAGCTPRPGCKPAT